MLRPTNLLFLLILVATCQALNLGFSPTLYRKGDKVELLVNKVESDHTQLPYGYYDLKFVCPPSKAKKPLHLSLAEVLRGDRIWQSDYNLVFGVDIPCTRLCDFNAREPQMKFADELIKNGYVVNWLVDNLPGATTFVSRNKNKYYAAGFPLGFHEDGVSYLYNHVMLVIRYHREKGHPGSHSIVGFEVYPKSVEDETCPGSSKEYNNLAVNLKKKTPDETLKLRIPYTYSVYWREDNSIDYKGRWDLYYAHEAQTHSNRIHSFALVNSVVLLALVTLVTAIIYYRVVGNDRDPLPLGGLDIENKSWRRFSQDILKRPQKPLLLSVFVASGMQLITATIGVICVVIIDDQFGFNIDRSYKGSAISSFAITWFVLSGIVPPFFGILAYKLFTNFDLNEKFSTSTNLSLSVMFSGFLPGLTVSIVLFLNFFVWAKDSSDAIPFSTMVIMLILFLFVSIPLGLIGGYHGNNFKFNKRSYLLYSTQETPGTNEKRMMPAVTSKVNWLSNTAIFTVLYGLIPFCIVYVELSFIFNSFWLEKTSFYYMYGFLLLTTIILLVIVAESSIIGILINMSLNNDPNWHWLVFKIGSSIGPYIYIYSVYYFFAHLNIGDFVSILLYFSYMALICFLVSIACGSLAVLAGLVFISKIFGNLKRD